MKKDKYLKMPTELTLPVVKPIVRYDGFKDFKDKLETDFNKIVQDYILGTDDNGIEGKGKIYHLNDKEPMNYSLSNCNEYDFLVENCPWITNINFGLDFIIEGESNNYNGGISLFSNTESPLLKNKQFQQNLEKLHLEKRLSNEAGLFDEDGISYWNTLANLSKYGEINFSELTPSQIKQTEIEHNFLIDCLYAAAGVTKTRPEVVRVDLSNYDFKLDD